MKKTITLAFLALSLVSVSSCKKKIIDKLAKEATKGTLTATVNGQPYTAQIVTTLVSSNSFMVRGTEHDTEKDLVISLSGYEKSKTKYLLSYGLNQASYTDENGNSKTSNEGEVEISNTGDNSATGKFHFKTNDGLDVTDGKFDIKWD
jgi:hypothetical protein